jgi:hypothetical protein
MGGMVLETNMSEILTHIEAQNKQEKSEVSFIVVMISLTFPKQYQQNCLGKEESSNLFILFFRLVLRQLQ